MENVGGPAKREAEKQEVDLAAQQDVLDIHLETWPASDIEHFLIVCPAPHTRHSWAKTVGCGSHKRWRNCHTRSAS